MKLTGFISFVFSIIYSVSTFVGIGVFRCDCTHTKRIVMLSVQPSCQCSNSHEKCCSHNDQFHNEEEEDVDCDHNCCSLEYQYVDVDQLNSKHFHNYQTKVLSLLFFPQFPVHGLNVGIKENVVAVRNNSPPPGLLKIPLIYKHRQLRL